jgi:RimJ/RimL family protein N-acetyltransferase
MEPQATSEALRFTFSPLCHGDLEFFNTVRNSASQYLHDQRKFTLDETKQWFEKRQQSNYWLVRLENQPVGYFRAKVIDPRTWEIGADLHESFRGQGLAKLMYRKFAHEILASNNVSKCSLKVLRSNSRAIHIYGTLGFLVTAETDIDFVMEMDVIGLSLAESPTETQT